MTLGSEWESDDDDAELHPPNLDSPTILYWYGQLLSRIGVPTTVLSSFSQLNNFRFVKGQSVVHDMNMILFTFQHAHFNTSSISLRIIVRINTFDERTMIRGIFMLSFLAIITAVVLLSATHGYNDAGSRLSFKPTSSPDIFTFTIIQIADIHLGEASNTDWGPTQDRKTYAALHTFLSIETPDLIVLSGDQLTANNVVDNATAYYDILGEFMDSYATPWGFIFGNHDDSSLDSTPDIPAKTTRRDLLKHTMKKYAKYGVTKQDTNDDVYGVSNYVLDVSLQDSLGAQIILLDSGGGTIDEAIRANQLAWLSNVRHVDTPAVAFQHIPTTEFVFNDALCIGSYGDGTIDTPRAGDAGLVNHLLTDGNVMFLSTGHDHGNDYCCPLQQQLSVCFGKHSGYGGYGNWDKGVRMFKLTANVKQKTLTYRTWIRMENGTLKNVYAPTTEFSYATIRSDTSSTKRNDNVVTENATTTEDSAAYLVKNGIAMSVIMSIAVLYLIF